MHNSDTTHSGLGLPVPGLLARGTRMIQRELGRLQRGSDSNHHQNQNIPALQARPPIHPYCRCEVVPDRGRGRDQSREGPEQRGRWTSPCTSQKGGATPWPGCLDLCRRPPLRHGPHAAARGSQRGARHQAGARFSIASRVRVLSWSSSVNRGARPLTGGRQPRCAAFDGRPSPAARGL